MPIRARFFSLAAAVVFASAVAPSLAFAQRTTTGTVIGKIVDTSGAVPPGI